MEEESHSIMFEDEKNEIEFKKLLNREKGDMKQDIKSFKAMD